MLNRIISNCHHTCEWKAATFSFNSQLNVCHFVFFSYGIANLAYRNLQDFNESQCICLLGEKGSGKTESARIILHFLSNVNLKPKLCAEQCSTKLLRCKSLASYPKFEFCDSEFKPERKRSIKYIRKVSRSIKSIRCWFEFMKLFSILHRNQRETLNMIICIRAWMMCHWVVIIAQRVHKQMLPLPLKLPIKKSIVMIEK